MATNISVEDCDKIYIGRSYKIIIPSNSNFNLYNSDNYIIDTNLPNPVIGSCTRYIVSNPFGNVPVYCAIYIYSTADSLWAEIVNGPQAPPVSFSQDSGTIGIIARGIGDQIYVKLGGAYLVSNRCGNTIPGISESILCTTGAEIAILVSPL